MSGAVERVRPKMMTVCAIMTGLLPIMWSHGTGAEVMQRIAVPIIGGKRRRASHVKRAQIFGGSVAPRGLPPLGPSDPGGREEALVGSSEVARGCYAPLLDMIPYVKVRNA